MFVEILISGKIVGEKGRKKKKKSKKIDRSVVKDQPNTGIAALKCITLTLNERRDLTVLFIKFNLFVNIVEKG